MRSANAPTKYALDDIRYDAGNDNNSNHNHNNRMINEFRYTQARSLSSTVGTADILRHTAAPVLFLDLHTPLLTYMLGSRSFARNSDGDAIGDCAGGLHWPTGESKGGPAAVVAVRLPFFISSPSELWLLSSSSSPSSKSIEEMACKKVLSFSNRDGMDPPLLLPLLLSLLCLGM